MFIYSWWTSRVLARELANIFVWLGRDGNCPFWLNEKAFFHCRCVLHKGHRALVTAGKGQLPKRQHNRAQITKVLPSMETGGRKHGKWGLFLTQESYLNAWTFVLVKVMSWSKACDFKLEDILVSVIYWQVPPKREGSCFSATSVNFMINTSSFWHLLSVQNVWVHARW